MVTNVYPQKLKQLETEPAAEEAAREMDARRCAADGAAEKKLTTPASRLFAALRLIERGYLPRRARRC
jgi:hypothetical protein